MNTETIHARLMAFAQDASGEPPERIVAEIAQPDWENTGFLTWQSCTPDELREAWDGLSDEARLIVFGFASKGLEDAHIGIEMSDERDRWA